MTASIHTTHPGLDGPSQHPFTMPTSPLLSHKKSRKGLRSSSSSCSPAPVPIVGIPYTQQVLVVASPADEVYATPTESPRSRGGFMTLLKQPQCASTPTSPRSLYSDLPSLSPTESISSSAISSLPQTPPLVCPLIAKAPLERKKARKKLVGLSSVQRAWLDELRRQEGADVPAGEQEGDDRAITSPTNLALYFSWPTPEQMGPMTIVSPRTSISEGRRSSRSEDRRNRSASSNPLHHHGTVAATRQRRQRGSSSSTVNLDSCLPSSRRGSRTTLGSGHDYVVPSPSGSRRSSVTSLQQLLQTNAKMSATSPSLPSQRPQLRSRTSRSGLSLSACEDEMKEASGCSTSADRVSDLSLGFHYSLIVPRRSSMLHSPVHQRSSLITNTDSPFSAVAEAQSEAIGNKINFHTEPPTPPPKSLYRLATMDNCAGAAACGENAPIQSASWFEPPMSPAPFTSTISFSSVL